MLRMLLVARSVATATGSHGVQLQIVTLFMEAMVYLKQPHVAVQMADLLPTEDSQVPSECSKRDMHLAAFHLVKAEALILQRKVGSH